MSDAGRKSSSLCRIVVLISGRGSNLRAIIDATASGGLPVELGAVISNRPHALGLMHAKEARIPWHVVDHRSHPDREFFDRALIESIDTYHPDLVALAGFMRILTPAFIEHYAGRLINIHPSLLPAFPGLHTHERALAAGVPEHGATVHFVTNEVDGGPAIVQAAVPVRPDDTVDSLAARVLAEEHRIYPLAIRWFAEGRLTLRGHQVLVDGRTGPACRSQKTT